MSSTPPDHYKHTDCDKAIIEERLDDACEDCRNHMFKPTTPPDQPEYTCGSCGYVCTDIQNLGQHMQQEHEADQPEDALRNEVYHKLDHLAEGAHHAYNSADMYIGWIDSTTDEIMRLFAEHKAQAGRAARIDELKTQVLSKPTHISRQLEQQIHERIEVLQATQPPAADTTKQEEGE